MQMYGMPCHAMACHRMPRHWMPCQGGCHTAHSFVHGLRFPLDPPPLPSMLSISSQDATHPHGMRYFCNYALHVSVAQARRLGVRAAQVH